MSEDIELAPLLGESKVHSGYGASRVPIKTSSTVGSAGSNYDKIFQSQLGSAASDPNNPIGNWFYNLFYGKKSVPEESSGLVLPFSNNIGPGNTISESRSRSDTIAQGHDLHYKDATSDLDVLSADREAISQFAYETVNPENPISQLQAGIGVIGLGAKHAIDKLTGKVTYGKYEL